MKLSVTILSMLMHLLSAGQNDTLDINWNSMIDKVEIRDSGFTSLFVLAERYSPESGLKKDTAYIATFDVEGRVVFEKIKSDEAYERTFTYTYSAGHLVNKVETFHHLDKSRPWIRHYSYEFQEGKLMRSFSGENGVWEDTPTLFYYDPKGRLVRQVLKGKKIGFETTYEYDERGYLRAAKSIEHYEDVTDSLFYGYAFDSDGRLVEEWLSPSKTYVSQMLAGCSEGSSYYNEYKYDSVGRKLYERSATSLRFKDIFAPSYFTYHENGYSSRSRGRHDVYIRKELTTFYTRSLFETYNESSKLTEYISTRSKLPALIQLKRGVNVTTYKFVFDKPL